MLTTLFTIGALASVLATELLRSLVHRHRVRTGGVGGTQDIAMIGTLSTFAFFLGAIISGVIRLVGE